MIYGGAIQSNLTRFCQILYKFIHFVLRVLFSQNLHNSVKSYSKLFSIYLKGAIQSKLSQNYSLYSKCAILSNLTQNYSLYSKCAIQSNLTQFCQVKSYTKLFSISNSVKSYTVLYSLCSRGAIQYRGNSHILRGEELLERVLLSCVWCRGLQIIGHLV